MKYSIYDLYLILSHRMPEDEIYKIAEVRKDIFESKIKTRDISSDQMALSIYFKMYSRISNDELYLLNRLNGMG